MKPPEEVKREFVQQWMSKAVSDLRAARHLATGDEAFTSAVAFHAQQAAEKALKAVLVWHQVEFTKTHDIGRLLELVANTERGVAERLEAASELTQYAVVHRYPGEAIAVTRDVAEQAMEVAARVLEAVLEHLPPDMHPPAASR